MSQVQTMMFLFRQPPYGSSRCNGALDILLTAATFDQKVILAFTGEGVFNLQAGQDAGTLGLKDISRALPALEIYGVEEVLVDADSLALNAMTVEELLIPAKPVTVHDLQQAMHSADQVFIC